MDRVDREADGLESGDWMKCNQCSVCLGWSFVIGKLEAWLGIEGRNLCETCDAVEELHVFVTWMHDGGVVNNLATSKSK